MKQLYRSILLTAMAACSSISMPVFGQATKMAAEAPLEGEAWQFGDAAFAAYNKKDYATAEQLASRALALRPDVTRLWLLRIYALQNLGRTREALQLTEKAISQGLRDPGLNTARANLNASLKTGVSSASVPTTQTPAWKLGQAAYADYAAGRYPSAEEAARKSLRMQPNNPQLRSLLVYTLEKQNKNEEAAKEADAALLLSPKDDALQALRDRMYRGLATKPAAAAWDAYRQAQYDNAADLAAQAVKMAPDVQSYQYLLSGALLSAGHNEQAQQASSKALAQDADDAFSLTLRAYANQKLNHTEEARADLDRAVKQDWLSDQQRATVQRIAKDTLRSHAAGSLKTASQSAPVVFCSTDGKDVICSLLPAGSSLAGSGPGYDAATRAYAAMQAHDYARAAQEAREALQAAPDNISYRLLLVNALALSGQKAQARQEFQTIAAAPDLPPENLLDAAYAAQRLSYNALASRYFSRAIDAADAGQIELAAQPRLNVRQAVSDLDRTWGASAALGYGTVGVENSSFAPALNRRQTLQATGEVYWRPPGIGLRDGSTFEIYGRLNETLYDGTGGGTGNATLQGVVGARWKPFGQQNLVLAVERFIPIGNDSRSDWLLRAAWSEGEGGGLRADKSNWQYWQVYAEGDYFVQHPQVLGTVEARYGRAFLVAPNFTITPYAVLNANYDDLLAQRSTVGIGPGVNLRYWFREDTYHAPRSFLDLNVQYRFAIAGDDRSNGIFAGLFLSY